MKETFQRQGRDSPAIFFFSTFYPQKMKTIFFNYFLEDIVIANFLYENVFFQRISFSLHSYLNENHEFFSEKRVFP